MPLSQLDPKPALIVIDLQKGIVGLSPAGSGVVDRSAQLAKAFRSQNLPVVLVNVTGRAPGRTDAGAPNFAFPPDWAELVPELEQQPTDRLVSKNCIGAFLGTDLDTYLRQQGVTQVFFTGIATTIGVESTARCAYDLGYNVVFVADAMADRSDENHNHSVANIFPRLGEIETTANVLEALTSMEAKAKANNGSR